MTFLAELLSPRISYGFVSTPRYDNQRIELPSKKVYRNILVDDPVYSFYATFDALSINDPVADAATYEELRTLFFRTRAAHSFLFKDWADYRLTAEVFAEGVASTQTYQLTKTYGTVDGNEWVRNILKPVTTVTVFGYSDRTAMKYYIDGVEDAGATVDASGIVTFAVSITGGEVLTATGDFDVPAFFERDDFPMTYERFRSGSAAIYLLEDKNL